MKLKLRDFFNKSKYAIVQYWYFNWHAFLIPQNKGFFRHRSSSEENLIFYRELLFLSATKANFIEKKNVSNHSILGHFGGQT